MWEMDKAFRNVKISQRINKSYDYMFIGLLTAISAWGGALALKQSSSKLIGFFDIQRTDVSAYFKSETSKDA